MGRQQWVCDLRIHAITGLPSADSSIELRVKRGALVLQTAEAESFDGVCFLGSWTRLALEEGSDQEVDIEVLHAYNRSWLLFSRTKLAGAARLRLELSPEGGGGWREEELRMAWVRESKTERIEEEVRKVVAEKLDDLEALHNDGGAAVQPIDLPEGAAAAAGDEGKLDGEEGSAPAEAGAAGGAATAAGKLDGAAGTPAAQAAKAAEGVEKGEVELVTAPGSSPPADGAAKEGEAAEAAAPQKGTAAAAVVGEEEEDSEQAKQLVLRVSYRAVPAGSEEALPAIGVPEVSNEPVEMATTPLPRLAHCYAHGGFMGLAVSMLSDERWRKILEREDPPSFFKAVKLYNKLVQRDPRPSKHLAALMTCLENSPVLCAYGLTRSGCAAPVGLPVIEPAAAAGPEPAVEGVPAESAGSAVAPTPASATASGSERAPGEQPQAATAVAEAGDGAPAEVSAAEGPAGAAAEPAAAAAEETAAGAAGGEEAAGGAAEEPGAEGSRDGTAAAAGGTARATREQLAAMTSSKLIGASYGLENLSDLAKRGSATAAAAAAAAAATAAPAQQAMEPAPSSASGAAPEDSKDEQPAVQGVFISRSGRGLKRLEGYLASIRVPNRYGYRPLALEWDLWVHPSRPSQIQHATVDHGTSGQLVTQAITTSMPCLKPLAKRAGMRQIAAYGISPVAWLNALGHSLNTAVNGDREAPLPLPPGTQESFYRLHATLLGAHGGVVDRSNLWDRLYVKAWVDSEAVVVPVQTTPRSKVADGQGPTWNADLSFWPLPLELERTDLVLEVRGDPAGLVRDSAVGMLRLPLRRLLQQYPALAEGRVVELDLPIGERQHRYIHDQQAAGNALSRRLEAATAGPKKESSKGWLAGARLKGAQGMADLQAQLPALPLGRGAEGENDGEEEEAEAREQAAEASRVGRGSLTLQLSFEEVGVMAAAESMGVTAAAAQTCMAMLAKPGGLYLDIKSAYTSARDLQLFVSTLKGIGVHCKAVCSFQKRQLAVGELADTVMFFHGISGLENACDDGSCERGQFVLFNGASFLADLKPAALKGLPAKSAKGALSQATDFPIDAFVLRKYMGLCETYGIAGGIYVQEPDASPASVSALAKLCTDYPEYFPLGFAYGHLSGLGINFLDQNGRGFAAQQIVEEFQARKELSKKVMVRIKNGEHRQASLATTIVWGQRILYGTPTITLAEQRTFIILLAQMWPHRHVKRVVDELGGIQRIFLRYFEHYELTTPLTLLEAGFNWNHTKDVIRLLRNRGVVAAMPPDEKLELARFFCSRQLRGYGLTWVLMLLRLRIGLHKFAKEGLLCVLESCNKEEFDLVLAGLGGRRTVRWRLRGRLLFSWHYTGRLEDVEKAHAEDPLALAYQNSELRYGALPTTYTRSDDASHGKAADPCHTRNKTKGEQAWRAMRKLGCCGFTTSYTTLLTLISFSTFCWCCVMPRCCGVAARRFLGVSALLAFAIFIAAVVLIIIFVPRADEAAAVV